MTHLRPEVESVHLVMLLMFETNGVGHTLTSLERYLVIINIIKNIIVYL